MSSLAEEISLPVGIRQKLEACIQNGQNHLDFADITPEGVELEKWHVAHAILYLVAYGGNSNFRGPMKCPVKTVRVTTQGPAFDLQSLAYGKTHVVTDCYPQLEPYDLLLLGLTISINLCREGSTLEHIDVSGNAIAERDFTEYVLSSLSLSGRMSSDAEEIVVGEHDGGTILLKSPSLRLNSLVAGLLTTKYHIPSLLKTCDRPKATELLAKSHKCSPLKSLNLGRNDVASFFPFFNHHPQLETLIMDDTEFGGHVYTTEEKESGDTRRAQRIEIEDEFTHSLRPYALGKAQSESYLHIETLQNGTDALMRSTMNTWSLLHSLSLRNCGMFGSNPQVLIKALESSHCVLKDLDLSFNPFSCQNVVDIINALQTNDSLKTLGLNSTCEFGRVKYKLSLDPDPLPDNQDRKSKTKDECENSFNSMMDAMANALTHNDTLVRLDLGNTELVGTHIMQLTQALRASTASMWCDSDSNQERCVVGDETVSFLQKRRRE